MTASKPQSRPEEADLHRILTRLRAEGRAPNTFIIGAQKCGTTSVARLLEGRPEVFVSPIKEPNFFCFDIRPEGFAPAFRNLQIESETDAIARSRREDVLYAYIDTPRCYASLFEDAAGVPLRCEASVTYLYSAAAAAAISELLPEARIIAILRDPVLRAFSQHRMQIRAGVEDETDFVSAVLRDHARPDVGWGRKHLYVEAGIYGRQLATWAERVPPERTHVTFFETLVRDRDAGALAALERFCELEPGGPSDMPSANAGGDPRSAALNSLLYRSGLKRMIQRAVPRSLKERGKRLFYSTAPAGVSEADYARLAPLFAADSAELEGRLGCPLPWSERLSRG